MSSEEFMSNYLGANGQNCSATAKSTLNRPKKQFSNDRIPVAFDWRDDRKVSPVKD